MRRFFLCLAFFFAFATLVSPFDAFSQEQDTKKATKQSKKSGKETKKQTTKAVTNKKEVANIEPKSALVPLTKEERALFLQKGVSHISFLKEYYLKNRKNGATDAEVLNEVITLDTDKESLALVDYLSAIGKRFKTMNETLDAVVDQLNVEILTTFPDKPEYLIDRHDKKTWKNLKYTTIQGQTLESYYDDFFKKDHYSETAITDFGLAYIATCAVKKESNSVLASLILSLNNGYYAVNRIEGQKAIGIKADFTGSENITPGNFMYPLAENFKINAQNTTGYAYQNIFPFEATVADPEKPALLVLSATVLLCKEGVCEQKTFPTISYPFPQKKYLETPVCTTLIEEKFKSPSNPETPTLNIEKTVIKNEKMGSSLYVFAKTPAINFNIPKIRVENEDGLLFGDYFMSSKGNSVLFRLPILNPKQLENKDSVDLILTSKTGGRSFERLIKTPVKETYKISFDFSILDLFNAFFLGIKFVFYTPLLIALSLLVYQMLFIKEKSAEKTIAFAQGLFKGIGLWITVCFGVFLALFYRPEGSFVWGQQLNSPFVDFILMLLLLLSPVWVMQLFDEKTIVSLREKKSHLFRFFNLPTNEHITGFLVICSVGVFLFFSPMIGLYFDIFKTLSYAPILNTLCFIAGILIVLFLPLLLYKKAATVRYQELPSLHKFLFLQAYLQSGLLLLTIGALAGLYVMLGIILAVIISTFILVRISDTKQTQKRILVTLCVLAICFIPFKQNEFSIVGYGAQTFDLAILKSSLEEGKAVYVNVSEPSCLVCHFNRLSMIHFAGKPALIQNNLIVMRANKNDPFIYDLLSQMDGFSLPSDLLYGAQAPEGMLLKPILKPAETKLIVHEILKK